MSEFNELDEILNSIKNRDALKNSEVPIEAPVKTRVQREAEEEARRKAEEAQKRAEEEARRKAEEVRKKAEEKARIKAEEARRQAELEEKLRQEKELEKLRKKEEAEKEAAFIAKQEAQKDSVQTPEVVEEEIREVEEESLPEIEPPKESLSEQNDESDSEDHLVWFEAEKETAKKEKKNFKVDFKAVGKNFKEKLVPAFKNILKKVLKKQVLIVLGVIVLIIALVIGGVKIYDYSKVAYLKPYEEKYGIEYPVGILKEMCDNYGKNQNVVGRIKITDTDTDNLIISQLTADSAYSYEGNDVFKEQQFMSFDVNGVSDIESIYATADGFLNASQRVDITTLMQKNTYRVIAAYYTNKNFEDDNDYVFPYNIYGNLTEKSLNHYADSIKHRNLYDTGYEFSADDKFVSITADSDFMSDFKFVILCVQTDEKDFEKSTKAGKVEKIRYPQVWYDVNNQENPYWLSAGWYPEMIINPENGKTKKTTEKDYDFEVER